MIGRTAPSNPWIFRQIREYLETGAYAEPTHLDRYEMMRTYYSMLIERREDIVLVLIDALERQKNFDRRLISPDARIAGVPDAGEIRLSVGGSWRGLSPRGGSPR